MKKLVKDAEGNLAELLSLNGSIPEGWQEVPAEELEAEELVLAKRNKMAEIRAKRDTMLLKNDKLWLIASKKGESVTALEQDAAVLRSLPELAQSAIDALPSVESIKAYDAFSGLDLSQSHE
jgi:hypothetical protein